MSRLRVVAAAAMAVALFGLPCARAADEEGFSLLQDTRFLRGFNVWAPEQGRIVVQDTLRTGWSEGDAVWRIAQWGSRFTLAGRDAARLSDRVLAWEDPGKRVTVTSGPDREPGLVLALNGIVEFEGEPRPHGQEWPHLLVSQNVTHPSRLDEGCPPLGTLRALPLRFEARLTRARREEPEGFNSRIHAAQFLAYVTLQDLDRDSEGFGDYLYLGVRAYDDRYEFPPLSMTPGDYGGGKFIHNPPVSAYTDGTMHGGDWVLFEADLLPLARDAVREARDRGFLENSESWEDLRVGSFSIGWEVAGLNDVEAEVRGLSLRAVPGQARDAPSAPTP